jgi:O-methyltransferase
MMMGAVLRRLGRTRLGAAMIEMLDADMDNRLSEKGILSHAFEFSHINGVAGDYFEFGLWRGKTFCHAHRMKRRYRLNSMRLWGFDSFQGLPEFHDEKDSIWTPGEFSCKIDDFHEIVRRSGFQEKEYELIQGFYNESLTPALQKKMAGVKAAVIYIDCDLYESTRDVLSFLPPFLQDGTIVCFDDYYNYKGSPDQGEQRALKEFLAARPQISFLPYLDYAPLGKSFIVRIS